jgi:GT2 family glycosyltransferase
MDTSIVIATHNEGSALASTIESCVETIANIDYEIVVADDASTDGSVDAAGQRFPLVRFVRHDRRQGASAAKALGARHARGDVLVFLDAHTRPEPGAIARLAHAVDELDERAIVTPAIAALDVEHWTTDLSQLGHGYGMDLLAFDTRWLPIEEMQGVETRVGHLFESPSLIGCAFAIGRNLYEELRGFDPHMRSWGVEDLDLALKCWQLGHRILHDPNVTIGHRFQSEFSAYDVPHEHVLVNKLRMARKNFTPAVWAEWTAACRDENAGPLAEHPEGLWAHAWQLLEADRPSLEQERSYLHARRVRDEFWYAERFGLSWPQLAGTGAGALTAGISPSASPAPSQRPSPSPPPSPTVEIQVNNTVASNDDLVVLRCQHPVQAQKVTCRIRLTSTEVQPVTIVLHDPAGRLLFPAAATATLTLPVSKAFVTFQITGQQASAAIGDALIEARVTNVSGPVAGKKPVTVVSFGSAQMNLTQGANYSLVGTTYNTVGSPAVKFSAQASILPSGVDCSAPQLTNIRIGIMQQVTGAAGAVTRVWTNPTVNFNAGIHGKTVVEHQTVSVESGFAPSVHQPVNDGWSGAFPFYDTGQHSANALKPPIGCSGGSAATSDDSPGTGFPATFSIPAVATDGTTVGNAIWQNRVHVTRTNHFGTYCVSLDTTTKVFCALRQASWDINLDSALPNQHATVTADAVATTSPAAVLPQANNAQQIATAAVSGAAKTFTSPP